MKTIVIVLLLNAFLGNKAKRISSRLIGGIPAKEHEFPFQGSLRLLQQHRCGVILITLTHLLSAAYCVKDIVEERPIKKGVDVNLGCTDLDKCITHLVSRISLHRDFKRAAGTSFYYHDLSVVHIFEPVEVSPCLAPIPLPDGRIVVPVESLVLVVGFGGQNKGENFSNWLLKIIAIVEPITNCQKAYYPTFILHTNYICTVTRRRIGAGVGDSGDAMVDMSRQTLLGISSGNNGVDANGNPNIFTNVSAYLPYIKEEINYFNSNNITLPNPPPGVNFPII